MTPYDIGRISAFLIKYRKIEDRPDKRGLQRDERDFALILREASIDSLRDLEDVMSGQGFTFLTLTPSDVQGIGQGARVYIASRRSDVACPLLDMSRMVERMDSVSGRSTAAKIWFTQLWLLHLDLLYTQRKRGPHERHDWLNAAFTREMLEQSLRDHVNGYVRRLHPQEIVSSEVYETLSAEKGTDISRYAKRFLDLMCDAGLLTERSAGVYRQTLLSAVEMKENYDRVLAPLVVSVKEAPQPVNATSLQLAILGQPLLTKAPDEAEEGSGR